jgi:glycosyltransferase involved in cell wall biosynthesis
MKIAYFSPLPPQKSGISEYSVYLLETLSEHAEVDVWVDGYTPSSQSILNHLKVIDYVQNPGHLAKLNEYDEIIYNIGNNPYYHSNIYDVFLKYNGIVILHDFVLYYLVTGYLLDHCKNPDLFLEELKMNHGNAGYVEGLEILRGDTPPLQYKYPEKWPLNKRLIDMAKGIIVHSEYAKNEVLRINPDANCTVIAQIGPDPGKIALTEKRRKELKEKYGIEQAEILLASFGYVAPSKRIHQVVDALSALKSYPFKYLLVGEGDYVKNQVKKYGLTDKVVYTGFTTIEEFDDLIALSDVVINLRYPYMGETSASLIRALLLGKASVVSDIGWFSELPDEVVYKIPLDDNEVATLRHCLKTLMENSKFREDLENKALQYSRQVLDRRVISSSVIKFIKQTKEKQVFEQTIYSLCDRIGIVLDEIGAHQFDKYITTLSQKIYDLVD